MAGAQGNDAETLRLRWLHELRMGRLAAAAATLGRAAPSERSCAGAARVACLAKLAALASAPGGLEPPPAQVVPPRHWQQMKTKLRV